MTGNTFFNSKSFSLKNLTRAAILTSISLVLNLALTIYIPIAGFSSLKFTLSAPVTMATGIICGPIFGMACGAITDIIAYLAHPVGPYFPGITLGVMAAGLIPSLVYKFMKNDKINYNIVNSIFMVLLALGCILAFKMKGLLSFENGTILYNKEPLHIAFIIGFIVLVVAYIIIPILISKKLKFNIKMDKVVFTVNITQLIASILMNTYFLSILFGKGFLVFLPARILSNFFMIPMYSIVIGTILEIANKKFKIEI